MDLMSATQKTGRPRHDDRLMLNGILWIMCSGAAWRDLPERFGAWSTVYQRYRDWRNDGTLEDILDRLRTRVNEDGVIDMESWILDPILFGGRLINDCA
jgi:transposase